MVKTTFLSLEEVLAIHHDQIAKYGGSHGIRDLNLLMSAVSRSQASFAGEDLYSGVFSKAAALMHSLIFNHPFVDGNKRTATVSTARFLFLNRYGFKVRKSNLVKDVVRIESQKWNVDKISLWLKKNSKKIRS